MKAIDLSNQTHGTFLVIARTPSKCRFWNARCTLCKKVSSHRADSLKRLTARCPCNDARIIHGDAARGGRDDLYVLWQNLRKRVREQAYSYPLVMESEWEPAKGGYRAFRDYIISTIGRRPSERHSLDRIDVFIGYIRGNLRWADDEEQADNRTSTKLIESPEYGAALTAREWAQHLTRITGDPFRWTRKRVESLLEHLTIEQIISAVHPARRTPQELAEAQQRALQRARDTELRQVEQEMDRWAPDGFNAPVCMPIAQDKEENAFDELFSD